MRRSAALLAVPVGDEQTGRSEQEASERERECVSRSQIYRLAPTNAPKPDEEAIKRLSAACMANPDEDRFSRAARTRAQKGLVITPAQTAIVKVPTLGVVGSLDEYLRISPLEEASTGRAPRNH